MPNFTALVSSPQIQTLNRQKSPSPFRTRAIYQPLLWLIIFLCLSHLASAQVPSINWQKTLGGANDDLFGDVKPTADGGYIAVGSVYSNSLDVSGNHGGFDLWIAKLDSSRNIVWQKAMGGRRDDGASAVLTTADGGYVVAGYAKSKDGDPVGQHGEYFGDFWVIRLDGSGNVIWQKTYGGYGEDIAQSIVATSDGGYVVAGYTSSTNGDVTGFHGKEYDLADLWIIKITSSGSLVWQKTLGGSKDEYAYDVVATSDGGYVIAGSTRSVDGDVTGYHSDGSNEFWTLFDAWVVKVDASGNLVWQKALGGLSGDYTYAITASPDGGYVLAGSTFSSDGDVTSNHGYNDCWVIKLNNAGNIIWQRTLGGTKEDIGLDVKVMADGGYVVAGQTNSVSPGLVNNQIGFDAWLVRLDESGNVVWQKTFGGSNQDQASVVTPLGNGSYLVGGQTKSNDGDVTGNHGAGFFDLWVVKLVTAPPLITGLTATPDPVCAGKPVLLTATIANVNASYTYKITSGSGVIAGGLSSNKLFSQSVVATGSGPQSFTLTVGNEVGSTSYVLPVTVISGNCDLKTPCVSVQSGDWSNPAIWLCGHVPTVSDLVIISSSHAVTVSNSAAQAQRIRNNGTIRYTSAGTKVFVQGE